MLFCSVDRKQRSRCPMIHYVMMLLPLTSTTTSLHRRPPRLLFDVTCPFGQNASVFVIYTGNTNVELNQFNDFEEEEQYHCNLLCQ